MSCCDSSRVITALILGSIFYWGIADSYCQSSDTESQCITYSVLGIILMTYGGLGTLFNICICFGCCFRGPNRANQEYLLQDDNYVNYLPADPAPPNQAELAINYYNYSQDNAEQGNLVAYRETYNQNQCTICLDKFEVNQPVAKLGCGHKFHQLCIADWIRKMTNCPVCRAIIQ